MNVLSIKNEKERYLKFGKYTRNCPKWILEKAGLIDNTTIDCEYIKKIIRVIAAEFDSQKHEITTTNDIKKSRFINVNQVLQTRLASCGAMSTVVASVLRNLAIPTKLIHGRYINGAQNIYHAWNEVLIGNTWVPFDIEGKKREISKSHVKSIEVVDWEEIEDNVEFQ